MMRYNSSEVVVGVTTRKGSKSEYPREMLGAIMGYSYQGT